MASLIDLIREPMLTPVAVADLKDQYIVECDIIDPVFRKRAGDLGHYFWAEHPESGLRIFDDRAAAEEALNAKREEGLSKGFDTLFRIRSLREECGWDARPASSVDTYYISRKIEGLPFPVPGFDGCRDPLIHTLSDNDRCGPSRLEFESVGAAWEAVRRDLESLRSERCALEDEAHLLESVLHRPWVPRDEVDTRDHIDFVADTVTEYGIYEDFVSGKPVYMDRYRGRVARRALGPYLLKALGRAMYFDIGADGCVKNVSFEQGFRTKWFGNPRNWPRGVLPTDMSAKISEREDLPNGLAVTYRIFQLPSETTAR